MSTIFEELISIRSTERQSNPLASESREAMYQRAMTLMSERCTSRHTVPERDTETPLICVKDQPYGKMSPKIIYVQQKRPLPMSPLKAWRGYNGNVYFEPIQVNKAPVGAPEYPSAEFGGCSEKLQSILSRSRLASRNKSLSSSHDSTDTESMRTPSATMYSKSTGGLSRGISAATTASGRSSKSRRGPRQMSLLDKGIVFSRFNENIHEDIEWIMGQESTGSLCISPEEKARLDKNKKLKHDREKIYKGSMVHKLFEKRHGHSANGKGGGRASNSTPTTFPRRGHPHYYSQSNQRLTNNSPDSILGYRSSMDKLPSLDYVKASLKSMESKYSTSEPMLNIMSPSEKLELDADIMKMTPYVKYDAQIRRAYKQKYGPDLKIT